MEGWGRRRRAGAQGCPPSDLPSGPWADAGGSSWVPPGPGRRGGRSQGQRPRMARGADARGWGRRLGARPPHPRRRQWQARGSAEAASMDPPVPSPCGGHSRGLMPREGARRPGGWPQAPSPGSPVPLRVLGGQNQPETNRPRNGGSRGRGRGVGPAWGGRGQWGAAGLPARVRGPGVGGPEGCWRLWLSLSPSPGLSLSLWSHPEVPQRRCLTHCPPVARAAGGAVASGAPSPHLPLPG